MPAATVGALCAVAAGVLACLGPRVLSWLPEPEEETARGAYADLAGRRWLLPALAAVSAVAAGLLGLVRGADPVLAGLVPLVPLGALLAVVDARTRLLPKRLVLPATAAALLLLGVEWLVERDAATLLRAVVGMLAARSLFWVLWWFRSTGMGFGDVRLAALVGLVLARAGWTAWGVGLYAGLLLFGAYALGLAVRRRDRGVLKQALPYGPFMLLGALVGLLWPT